MRLRTCFALSAVVATLVAAGCGTTTSGSSSQPRSDSVAPAGRYSKVLVIVEENKTYGEIIGNSQAPYLNKLATSYGTAEHMGAGYAPKCPSLAAYALMTSGSTHAICHDKDAAEVRLEGDNVFQQVAKSGREWRNYVETMPEPCRLKSSGRAMYLVRHAPAAYYVSEESRCRKWHIPMGTATGGAFHDDLAAGTLPAYSFLTPNACNDMHGANQCKDNLIAAGDAWLADWLPRIMAGPDYTSGRLAVIITWDEGNEEDNHIPTLVVSPTTKGKSVSTSFTLCSVLRTTEELLSLPLLGCAANAASMTKPFGLH
jgi:hypothetical protein